MPLPIFARDLEYAHLTYRPDLQVLFLRWTRPVSSEEHQAGYHAALAVAAEQTAGHWLVDLRSRGLASAEDFRWVLREFRLLLRAAVPVTTRRVAYLVTPYQEPTIQQRLTDEDATLAADVRAGAAVGIFTEETAAQQWLKTGAA